MANSGLLEDVIAAGGVLLLVYGVWQVSTPAAWMAAGLALVAVAVALARRRG